MIINCAYYTKKYKNYEYFVGYRTDKQNKRQYTSVEYNINHTEIVTTILGNYLCISHIYLNHTRL